MSEKKRIKKDYAPEFREQAARLGLVEKMSVAAVAKDLGKSRARAGKPAPKANVRARTRRGSVQISGEHPGVRVTVPVTPT